MEIIAGIASVVGIVTGLWFFIDKIKPSNKTVTWEVEDRIVNTEWVEQSGIRETWESKGFSLVWANIKNVEESLLKGYVLVIEENHEKHTKYKLVRPDQALMAKPNT